MTHSHDTSTPALSVESAEASDLRVYGPYGWLVKPIGLAEDEWSLESDPTGDDEHAVSVPLYALEPQKLGVTSKSADWLRESLQDCANGLSSRPEELRGPYTLTPAPNPSPAAKGGEAEATTTEEGRYNVEAIAKVISLSYGENPEDYAPLSRICGPNNESLPCWMAYEEQAEAVWVWMQAVIEQLDAPALATPSPQPADAVREAVTEALGAELSGAYDCTRVWEAWNVGTMDRDDFVPVNDRLDEIVESILATTHPTTPLTDDRIIEIAIAHSNCKFDRWKEVFTHDQIISFARDILSVAVLASDPAPAGEAVEPLEDRIDNAVQAMSETHHSWESRCHAIMAALGFNFGWSDPKCDEDPATSNNARLREDLGQAESDKAILYTKLQDAERERDDAREALETTAEDALDKFYERLLQACYHSGRPAWALLQEMGHMLPADRAAARSASREGASDPAPATDDRERLVEANHRLMNLLYLADEALMELHGCFPNDEVTEEQRRLKQTCKAIRALTGEDYLNRKGRAAVARAALATEASK